MCKDGKRKYSNLKSILKSLRFSSLAFSVDPLSVDQFTCTVGYQTGVMYTRNRTHAGVMRRRAWVQKLQARRCCVNSLLKTVTWQHQAAKLFAALLRVARVTAGLAESNGSLPPGLWLISPAGWLPRTGISSGTLRSAIEYWLPLLFYFWLFTLSQKKNQSIIHLPTPLENAPH